MSENMNNPLNSFLEDDGNSAQNLFADMSFDEPDAVPASTPQSVPAQNAPQTATPPTAAPTAQPSLFAQAVAQTPVAQQQFVAPAPVQQAPAQAPIQQAPAQQVPVQTAPTVVQEAPPTSFEDALAKAKAQSEGRLVDSFAEKAAFFNYGKAKDEIADRDCTFEDLRQKYEGDFPELSESKKVSWTVTYGKVNKPITNPGSDKVYDIKLEIEKSKAFLDGIKKAKNESDKNPECIVKPRVIAQSKGEILKLPDYKDYCASVEDAMRSEKSIVVLPSKDGRLYQMRKTPVGTFTAPAENLPEFPQIQSGFQMQLPKIPMHILMYILNFFEELTQRYEIEALVHILYDTKHQKYTMRVPKQELTHVSVHSVMEEEYPDYMIHVMDIHSHNTMPARFSPIDDDDEKATRLYAVVGRLDKMFPDITVRASCAGQFIPLKPEDVFETNFKAFPYPSMWDSQIVMNKPEPKALLPEPKTQPSERRFFRVGVR